MSGTDEAAQPPATSPAGGKVPADVPAEFEETYRAAYAAAISDAAGTGAGPEATPPRAASCAGRRRAVRPGVRPPWPTWSAWSTPAAKALLAGVVAVVLVLGAYAVGEAFSGGDSAGHTGSAAATAYTGPVTPIQPIGAVASCTAPPSVDAGGRRITYPPTNTLDGRASTAWRCAGRGVGERLTFSLPAHATVVEVGLVPGYAKTDPVSGADRYAEENRITAVRWTIGDRTVVQHFSADPHDRTLRTLRVPATTTDRVRLEILATAPGARNVTAISEVALRSPAR